MKKYVLFVLVLAFAKAGFSQNVIYTKTTAFGFKGGPTLATQKWDSYDQGPLFKWHAIGFVESVSDDNMYNVFAQLGYHYRGSALRQQNIFRTDGSSFRLSTQEFQFRNAALTLGAKSQIKGLANGKAYYLLGARGEYTINTNLDEYDDPDGTSTLYLSFPKDDFVQKFNFGITFGGGWEFGLSEYVSAMAEITINQDFSRQYWQPSISNIPDPFNAGNTITVGERQIRNTSIELTVGLRFLRIVEYTD